MIKTLAELKAYFKAGKKVKMTFHHNKRTELLGTVRGVVSMSSKEWVWEGGSVQPPLTLDNVRYDLKGFSVIIF
jgi:hypothetical protein